jgi:hypothetical protein
MTVTVTLAQLIDRTMFDLAAPGEQGKQVVIGSTALTTTAATTFTLTDGTNINVSDVAEFGDELVLITGKTDDAVPVFTAARGYYGSTAATHAAGTIGLVNPTFPRRRIAEAIRRAFPRLEALGVPLVQSTTLNREVGLAYCQLPVDCREVYQVMYWGTDGRLYHLNGWEQFDDVPTAKFSTGKILNLPRYLEDTDDIEVIYRAPYRWSTYPSDPDGDATITVPEGAEDLPSLYAAAWLTSNREVSRLEIDRSEEWGRTEQVQRGVTAALVRAKWQEFYRSLDEARRLNRTPTPIIYRSGKRL